MRLIAFFNVLLVAATLALPARAADSDPFAALEPLLTPQALLGGVIRDTDVSLLLDHVRAAMLAAAEGGEAPPLPEVLGRRLETAGGELHRRGTLIGLALSQAIERSLRDALRDWSRSQRAGD